MSKLLRPGLISPYRGSLRPSRTFKINSDSWQSDGLILAYPGQGYRDLSVSRLLGDFVNDANFASDAEFGPVVDLVGQGTQGNGDSNGTFSFGTTPTLFGTPGLSVCAWVRNHKDRISGTGGESIVKKFGGGADTLSLLWDNGENVVFSVTTSSAVSSSFIDGIPVGAGDTWHHIAGVYNGIDIRIYVDGIQGVSTPSLQTGDVNNTSHPLSLGSSVTSASWDGVIADCRIYNRGLSAQEVVALSNTSTRWDLYRPVYGAIPISLAELIAASNLKLERANLDGTNRETFDLFE